MAERIEISGTNKNINSKWKPYLGEELYNLIKYKGFVDTNGNINNTGEKVIDETFRILEMCGNPSEPTNVDTGLVIGYVQSGKTLSFTSLTALAKDNNYQIIIIIAGTSTPLSEQSFERMKKDLRYENRFDRKWIIIKNPENQAHRDSIETNLEKWADNTYPRENCSTLLLTVMKNGTRLRSIAEIFRGLNLNRVPTLIIDDESDQASLNTRSRVNAREGIDVNEGQASTIYRRINELRNLFPHHTFLQYTATPQANLFINIMDRLSPNFIKLLKPGEGYAGGNVFFASNSNLVRKIPNIEIPTNNNLLTVAPDSLLYALKIFFLGVVAGEIKNYDQGNRSMMIHPSRLTDSQEVYFGWINSIIGSWIRILQSTDEDDKRDLLDLFKIAHEDLVKTVGSNIPSFESLVSNNKLLHSLRYTRTIRVNATSGRTPVIPWRDSYAWILVGGQAMDRGFTVEGLTVSYMPRSLATGQVDTTLQRARFFGYKGAYLGYCRVWLDQNNIAAFKAIIEHEEDVRKRLEEFDVNNKHLNNWDRETVLNQILNLTRPNILYNDLDRDYFGAEWFIVKAPHDTDNIISKNNEVVNEFNNNHMNDFGNDIGHLERTELQKHLVLQLSLSDCLRNLLNRLKFTRESDSQTFSSLRGILGSYLQENSDEECLVFLMSSKIEGERINQTIRHRRLTSNDEIQQLFQGEQPTINGKFKRGEVYPGDRNIKSETLVSIQIHRLHLTNTNGEEIFDEKDESMYGDVYSIAIWIPEKIGKDIIRQSNDL
ncbi:MAG: hypothetical protein BroJett005_21870 [Ignavibacteriota bacterium]|nr:MAG: hypothetical protein BroJett005_21870 [Ignavibacteriota bacterium]